MGFQHSASLSTKVESFPNLESFCHDRNNTILTPVWFQKSQKGNEGQKHAFFRKTSSTSKPSLLRLISSGTGFSISEKSILGNACATLRHFRCLSLSLQGVSFTLHNLLVLELTYVGSQDFPSGLSCPNSKVLGLGYLGIKKIDLPKNFPPSVEQLWFKGHIGSNNPPGFKRGGLESIKKFYTRLNTIRIDLIISLYSDEILKLVKWRKGVYNEWKWEGAKRCPIQRLVLDFSKLDEKCFKELQKRVPQLEDSQTTLNEIWVDI